MLCANIGYTSLVAAAALGGSGKILSIEAHPEIYDELRSNIDLNRTKLSAIEIRLLNAAASSQIGTAQLCVEVVKGNRGTSSLEPLGGTGTIEVDTVRLDQLTLDGDVQLVKIDVEGHELSVLQGAERLLEEHRIHHILFEENHIESSDVPDYLQSFGYTTYRVVGTFWGPHLTSTLEADVKAKATDPPAFVASANTDALLDRFRTRGWNCLRPSSNRRLRFSAFEAGKSTK